MNAAVWGALVLGALIGGTFGWWLGFGAGWDEADKARPGSPAWHEERRRRGN